MIARSNERLSDTTHSANARARSPRRQTFVLISRSSGNSPTWGTARYWPSFA
jgi:hypothetical protein